MGIYKNPNYIAKSDHSAFDDVHKPGAITPWSGIYRCTTCDVEVVSEKGKPLPPTHAHKLQDHELRWKLAVYADHEGKKP